MNYAKLRTVSYQSPRGPPPWCPLHPGRTQFDSEYEYLLRARAWGSARARPLATGLRAASSPMFRLYVIKLPFAWCMIYDAQRKTSWPWGNLHFCGMRSVPGTGRTATQPQARAEAPPPARAGPGRPSVGLAGRGAGDVGSRERNKNGQRRTGTCPT